MLLRTFGASFACCLTSINAHALPAERFLASEQAATVEASRSIARLPDLSMTKHSEIAESFRAEMITVRKAAEGWSPFLSLASSNFDLARSNKSPQYSSDRERILAGFEYSGSRVSAFKIGLGLEREEGKFQDGTVLDNETVTIQSAAKFSIEGTALLVSAGYSEDKFLSLDRPTGLPLNAARGSTKGRSASINIGLLERFDRGQISLSLLSSINYSHTWVDGFSEANATRLGLKFADQQHEQLSFQENILLQWHASDRDALTITPTLRASLGQSLIDPDHTLTSRLIDNTANAQIVSSSLAEDFSGEASVGVDIGFKSGVQLGVSFRQHLFGDAKKTNGFGVQARFTF